MNLSKSSRRSFIRQGALLSAATAISPKLLFGRNDVKLAKPGERVNIACIGIGNRGAEDIEALYATGLINIVALCDVDMGAPHTLKILAKFPDAKRFQDFRQMFDKISNEFEAVCIGVPDFSHFPITMMALGMGKHVYVEKPMARTFNEVELMMKAAKKYPKLVTQMGNQGHSEANYFQFKAWVDAGIIKDVTAITAHMNSARRWHGWDPRISTFPPPEPIPSTLDGMYGKWQPRAIAIM